MSSLSRTLLSSASPSCQQLTSCLCSQCCLQLAQICPPAPALGDATADVLHRGPLFGLVRAVFLSSAESEEKNLLCLSALEDCVQVGIPSTSDPSPLLVYILVKDLRDFLSVNEIHVEILCCDASDAGSWMKCPQNTRRG